MSIDARAEAAEYAAQRAGWLMQCAYLLTGNRQAAEDLAQETLLAVLRNWSRVSKADHRDGYVARIMLNTLRSGARRRTLTEVAYDEPAHDQQLAHYPVRDIDDADQIWQAMRALTARQRAALVLRYWSDLDDEAIASALRCRRATVRSLVARGIATLRTTMGEDDD